MSLKIVKIYRRADDVESGPGDERVFIKVLAKCRTANLMLMDNTYARDGEESDKNRHPFVFPDVEVGAEVGTKEFVRVYTRAFSNSPKFKRVYRKTVEDMDDGSQRTIHNFYWGLGEPIWNADGDCAYLLDTRLITHA